MFHMSYIILISDIHFHIGNLYHDLGEGDENWWHNIIR